MVRSCSTDSNFTLALVGTKARADLALNTCHCRKENRGGTSSWLPLITSVFTFH